MLHLKKAALRSFLGPGDGPGREQVARTQVTAIAAVMRNELRDVPIQIAQVSPA